METLNTNALHKFYHILSNTSTKDQFKDICATIKNLPNFKDTSKVGSWGVDARLAMEDEESLKHVGS